MAIEKAKLIAEGFSLMGYDAVAVGDDDLSLGKEFLLDLSRKVNFPFLSSNLVDETSGKPLFQTSLIKKSNGLRIGVFSLLAPDAIPNPYDPRKKGLLLRSPAETAQAMVRELQPKTDLIILLSHLGYPKDVELAQTSSGIHLIVGGHTGVNLPYPPVIRQSLIVQMAPKGLYGGRLDLIFHSNESHFFNASEKRTLETNLSQFKERIAFSDAKEIETWLQYNFGAYSRTLHLARLYQIPFPEEFLQNLRDLVASLKANETAKEKTLRTTVKKEAEQILKQLQGKNEFLHNLVALGEQIKDHPEIGKMVEAFRTKYPNPEKSAPLRHEAPRPKTGLPLN